MAYVVSKYSVSKKTGKKSPTRYVDTETGEDISAREKRNRTEAARTGFANLSQKQAHQKELKRLIDFSKTVKRGKQKVHIYTAGTIGDAIEAAELWGDRTVVSIVVHITQIKGASKSEKQEDKYYTFQPAITVGKLKKKDFTQAVQDLWDNVVADGGDIDEVYLWRIV